MPINIADSIRSALHAVVAQRMSLESSSNAILETTLVRNGAYCGRRFSLMGYSLVWFQEEGQVKLYAPGGTLELSCSLMQFCGLATEQVSQHRRAA
jgi:hypothetical protein